MKALLFLLVLCAAAVAQTAPPTIHPEPGELQSDCEHGFNQNACEHHATSFSKPISPGGSGHRSLVFQDLNTYGPSINFGNSGGWTITHVIEAPHIVFGTSGIDQYQSASVIKNGTGDLAGLYLYVYGGGRAAQSDEGVTGLTVESGEIPGYFHGTIASGGAPGATSLTLTDNPSAPHDWRYTCDGCMLLDISKGTIAGNLNGKSVPVPGTYLMQLPTANDSIGGAPAPLPLTRAWCALNADVPPTSTAGVGTMRTINCTLRPIAGSTRPFRAGQIATIAGQSYPEQVMIAQAGKPSGGVQSLTFAARNPNPAGSILFQGGIAGQSLSFDDNLAVTGFRSSYYVFGSVDGTNLIYGSQIGGTLNPRHTLPRTGADAESTTSGFHLYPSAEIVANTVQPSAPILEPNAVAWANGDIVEDPRFQSFGGVGIRDVCQAFTPSDEGVASSCMQLQVSGPGVSGTYHPFRMTNFNPISLYKAGGGKLGGVPAFAITGPFSDLLAFYNGPSGDSSIGSVIDITHTANNDNTPFNLFSLPSGHIAGTTTVSYDPGTHLIGFPQGIVAGNIGTEHDCASASPRPDCGQAAAGSIVIPSGATSILVLTAKVTAASEILITPDTSLGAKLGIDCNRSLPAAFTPYGITARAPGRSFTLSIANPASAPNCYSFTIIN